MDQNFFVSEEDKQQIRKILGTNEKALARDVEILKEWMKKQPHLPQGIQDDDFFEKMLIRNKCRVEKAKECIDSYYTVRAVFPELFENLKDLIPSKSNVELSLKKFANRGHDEKVLKKCLQMSANLDPQKPKPRTLLPLKHLTKNKERLLFCKIVSPDPSVYNFKDFIDNLLALSEILAKHDYSTGVRLVTDFENFGAETALKIPPVLLAKGEKVFRAAYSLRVSALDFYKTKNWLSVFLKIANKALSKKIYDRIIVHNDIESLWEHVPKQLLPKEYGGNEKTLDEMLADWDQVFTENVKLLEDTRTVKSNEKLRMGKCKFDTDIFGAEGTFKQIALD